MIRALRVAKNILQMRLTMEPVAKAPKLQVEKVIEIIKEVFWIKIAIGLLNLNLIC